MSTSSTTAENDIDSQQRSIDHARYVRACSEPMTVTAIAPDMKTVMHDGEGYDVDLASGACDGPDARYRNVICKHIIKAALAAIYTDGIHTPVVAQVARHAAAHHCLAGNHSICDGPTGPRFPCPDCVAATTVDDWTVWQQTAGRTGVRR